jgi:hypothetical protein
VVAMKSSIFLYKTPCSPLKVNQVSDEYVASIFKVEEWSKHETTVKQVAVIAWFRR